MGRVLAIDYGLKRTGLALTGPLQISINPLPTVETKVFAERLKSLISLEDISTVVFGLSTHSDGNLTSVGIKVAKLIESFQSEYTEIEFTTIDESFSSVEAMNLLIEMGVKKSVRRKKEKIDQMSAVVILKKYLNSQS